MTRRQCRLRPPLRGGRLHRREGQSARALAHPRSAHHGGKSGPYSPISSSAAARWCRRLVIDASVAIKDGVIVAVGDDDAMPAARETLDASGLHVLPGAIDVHVHFRDPGYPHKEDFESGTAAAAFGGVTTVFDMPNTIPPTGTADVLAAKHRIASSKAHVDYGLYGLLGEDTIEHVPALIEGGVIGFKLYMGNTFGKIPSPSTGAMLEAFEAVAPTGKRISLHAETNSIMERRETRLRTAGRTDPLAHIASRPAVVAVEAVSRAAHPGRMDRRAHPHPAHFVGRGVAPVARSQGARRRHHRRDRPALPDALDRRLCAPRRRHPRQPAGARGAQSGAAVAGARRRHHRHGRHRPRAARARGEDPQRHLDGRLRLSRGRDPDAADADGDECWAASRSATMCAGAPPIRPRPSGSIRARA